MGNSLTKKSTKSYVESPKTTPSIMFERAYDPHTRKLEQDNRNKTLSTTELTTSVCYVCSKTKGRNNTGLFEFNIKDVNEKQLLCIDCYTNLNNKKMIYHKPISESSCSYCNKTGVQLYNKGPQSSLICGDCID